MSFQPVTNSTLSNAADRSNTRLIQGVPDAMGGCCIIIPAFNPQPLLLSLLEDLLDQGFRHILLIDDGSATELRPIFDSAQTIGAKVLRHAKNQGKGAALKTAFAYAQQQGYVGVVTMDADGQHSALDAGRVARQILTEKSPVCILGVRTFASDVPLRSKFGNLLTARIFEATASTRVSDTQTGLRGFSASLLPQLCEVTGQRYEFEMQMLMWLVKSQLPIKEIPIDTIYIDNNTHSHFHPIIDSLKIYWVLCRDFFVSVSSFGIDIALFSLFYALTLQIIPSTFMARFISGAYNFLGNKIVVFRLSKSSGSRFMLELCQYIGLAVLLATVSGTMVELLVNRSGWSVTLCKIGVDLMLYLGSFLVRRYVIFKA